MVVDELHRHHIRDRAGRSLFIVLSPPGLNHGLCFPDREKLVLVQTLLTKLPVDAFNKRVLVRPPRLDEVRPYPVLISPHIKRRPRELQSVV